MHFKRYLSLAIIASTLTACHDDDEVIHSPAAPVAPSPMLSLAASAYQGSTDTAAQTASNAKRFPTAAFAARDYFLTANNLAASVPGLDTYGRDTCSNGGTATQETNIDPTSKLGTKNIQFSNCQIADIVVDGPMLIDVTAYDAANSMPTDVTITYEGLKQTRQGTSVTLTGTVKASQNYPQRSVLLTFDGHLKSSNGQELLTDMSVDVRGDVATRAAISTYSGKVCIDDEGCVDINTETPFTVQYTGVVKSGELITTGAANSKMQVVANYGMYQYQVDADGDGNYD